MIFVLSFQIQGLYQNTPFSNSYRAVGKAKVLTLCYVDWCYLLKHFPKSKFNIYDDKGDDDEEERKHVQIGSVRTTQNEPSLRPSELPESIKEEGKKDSDKSKLEAEFIASIQEVAKNGVSHLSDTIPQSFAEAPKDDTSVLRDTQDEELVLKLVKSPSTLETSEGFVADVHQSMKKSFAKPEKNSQDHIAKSFSDESTPKIATSFTSEGIVKAENMEFSASDTKTANIEGGTFEKSPVKIDEA